MEKISQRRKWILKTLAFVVGIGVGAMLIFNIFFLMKVLPHAGF